nr:alpha/beta fold hydrolase [Butyrivibrio sp.]
LTGEEKQAEYPCYIMAPQIENNVFLSASSRKSLYDELKTEAERLVKAGRVDGDRIYIMGYSFGGLATTEFAENYPDYIAAAIVMCPALTYDDSSTQNLKLMKDVPVWFAHAGGDNVIPVNVSRSAVSTLEALGAPEVHYTEFSDEEMKTAGAMYGYHQADYAVMADEQFMNWLFGKKKK